MVLATSMAVALGEPAPGTAAMGANADAGPQSSPDSEARRLASAVARGEETAFQELYDRYQERLFRLLVVQSRGEETIAQEVVQSAMLTAAARLRPVETEQHLWNWLARVARQHLLKEWRRRRREPTLVGWAELPEVAGPVEADDALEEGLDAALLALEAEDRQVIEWFYFDGVSHKEIAERLESTPKAVSSRLERVRAKLRLLLRRTLAHET